MSSLENFFATLFSDDTTVVLEETGTELSLAAFLTLAAEVLDEDSPTPPKRNTPEYREAITHVATLDDMGAVIGALGKLWADYGWRGPADVMVQWIGQIENAPLTQHGRYRDVTGVVDLRLIIVIEADEEQQLRMAADKQERLVKEEGLAPHLALQKGLAETEAGMALTQRWYPTFRAALAAAHTTGDRRDVLAALAKGPGRNDRDTLTQGAMVLGTAAYGVRHALEMAARFEEVAKGREAVSDESIAPGWSSGGYITQTAMRRR